MKHFSLAVLTSLALWSCAHPEAPESKAASTDASSAAASTGSPSAAASTDASSAAVADASQPKPSAVVDVKKDCNADVFCTREYIPTTCRYLDKEFSSANPCEAKKLARAYACESGKDYDDAKVQCKSKKALPK